MPFDGTNLPSIDALEKLDAVMHLLHDESRWCKRALVNAEGQMCLMGALRSAGSDAALKPHILYAIQEVTGARFRTIESFNDHRYTTHAVVLEVLRRTGANIALGHPPSPPRSPSLGERCQSYLRSRYYRLGLTIG